MNKEHVISDEVLEIIQLAISRNENWMAYNNSLYFIDKSDVYFYKTKDEANEFASNNVSDHDHYNVMYVQSLTDVLRQIPYGERINEQLSGNPDANGLYNQDGNPFTDALIDHIEKQQLLNNSKENVMNEKNYDYLNNQLKYTGFGEDLREQLKQQMQKQDPQFTLTFQKDYGKDQTVATLQFRKSEESDMYFFNRYNLMLKNDQLPDAIKQTFYIGNKEDNITLKEAYNLMSGRAVHKELSNKEGQQYKAWLQLDFKQTDKNGNYKLHPYNEKYGFDLEKAMTIHNIKEMNDPQQKERLIESLERGNRQSVTITLNDKENKLFIEAAPRFKSLNIYDQTGRRLKADELYQKNSPEQSIKQDDKKQSQKQGGEEDGTEAEPGQKKSRRKRQNIT